MDWNGHFSCKFTATHIYLSCSLLASISIYFGNPVAEYRGLLPQFGKGVPNFLKKYGTTFSAMLNTASVGKL